MILALAASFGLLGGCASSMNFSSDSNPDINVERYSSYAWVAANPLISGPTEMSPINNQRIMNAIAANLDAKGYARVEDPNAADFAVGYTVGSRDKIQVDSYPSHFQHTGRWGRGYWGMFPEYDTHVSSYTEGRLAIDVFDVRSGQPAWHGWATKNVTESDQRNSGPVIIEAVDGILASFPARAQ